MKLWLKHYGYRIAAEFRAWRLISRVAFFRFCEYLDNA